MIWIHFQRSNYYSGQPFFFVDLNNFGGQVSALKMLQKMNFILFKVLLKSTKLYFLDS